MQPSHTAGPAKLVEVAAGCGFEAVYDIDDEADVDRLSAAHPSQADLEGGGGGDRTARLA